MKAYIVETAKLRHNLDLLKAHAGKTLIWGVVKGNGYGLGAAPMARFLAGEGIDHFAVTALEEAKAIRDEGLTGPILLIRGSCERQELEQCLDLNVIASVGSAEDLEALEALAAQRDVTAQAHLKIDTGMGRYGFDPDEDAESVIRAYRAYPHIQITGIYTHFHTAGNKAVTEAQYRDFRRVLDRLESQGIEPGMVHCCNSIAFWKYPEMHCDAVRLGSCLLGRVYYGPEAGLQRVGYVRAAVEEMRSLAKGHNVGYGGDCTVKNNTVTAVVGVGYLHGFSVERGYDVFRPIDCLRSMGRYLKYLLKRRKLTVEINGKTCPVLGHVGMVNLVADVTGVPCKVGDPVIVQVNPLDLKAMEVRFE